MGTINIKRQLITSFSIIFGSILAAAVALYFLVGKINATLSGVAINEALINRQTGSLVVIAALVQQQAQATVYEMAMDQLLPTQDGLIGFSQWISGIASQDQVTANVTFQGNGVAAVLPSGSAAGLGQMAFSLSANGDPDSLASFLDDVESQAGGFLVSFSSFDLVSSGGNDQLDAQGVVYFQQ